MKKNIKKQFILLFLLIFTTGVATAIGSGNTDGNTSRDFILNMDNENGDVALSFGSDLANYLQWNDSKSSFELSDSLEIYGDTTVDRKLLVKNSEIIHTENSYRDEFLNNEITWNLLQTSETEDPNDKYFPTITSGNGWKKQFPLSRWKMGDEENLGNHYGYVGYLPEKNKEFRINTGGEDITELAFGTMGRDSLWINKDENVGIGTNNPSAKLQIFEENNDSAEYRFTENSTSGYTTTFNMDDTGLYIGHDTNIRSLNLQTNSADRLTILGNGNVGIGTTEPDELLHVAGNMRLDGSVKDKDGEVGTSGQVLSSTTTGTDWITNSSNPIPFISSGENSMNPSTTVNMTISGENFTPTTTVSIPGFDGTINSTTVNSSSKLVVNITAGTTETTYDIIISNNGVLNTEWTGNGVGLLIVKTSNWIDLRAGGDTFTAGNGAGNDIRYRSGMSMTRDANGMSFAGSSPWSSWVKFESLGWTRGTNKTLQWIFTSPTSSMMIGIGSSATNETNTSQYSQAEVEAYFQNSTTMYGLYGNNGTIGSAGNQSNSTTIPSGAVFKIKFTNDGTAGSSVFTLYQIPSASPADWDDESTVLKTFTVGGSLSPNETDIMPFIIPRDGDTQRFIAVIVE